jgi:toxin ParE1/3/4
MEYKIIVSPQAQKDIEEAIDFYGQESMYAPVHFIRAVRESYHIISLNPFFCICYKNIRSLKLKRFPYSLFFVVNEEKQTIRILSFFHNKRNPINRP